MKIIQSFWSKPFLYSDSMLIDARLNGGWPHRILNYYSMALSCLLLRKYYDNVELVTDTIGKEILIDQLDLPYTGISLALNDIGHINPGLWTLGKVYTYGLQTEPFLHVDGDVFILNEFEEAIMKAPLVVQTLDKDYPSFSGSSKLIWDSLVNLPGYFNETVERQYTDSANHGIVGGTDTDFFHNYKNEVFAVFENNMDAITGSAIRIDAGCTSVILDQVIFYLYARHCNKQITYLFPEDYDGPIRIGYFHTASKNKGFIHTLGFYKKLRISYSYLQWKLKTEFPGYYEKITKLVYTSEI